MTSHGMYDDKKDEMKYDNEELKVTKKRTRKYSLSNFESVAIISQGAFGLIELVKLVTKDETKPMVMK
jgi:hypothetical protein